MNETELRALFADAVAKGAMSQADLDKMVADKIAKGECKADDDKDKDDDDKDDKFMADAIDKAASALADLTDKMNKADTSGWEDPGSPSTGATNPETRPPTERTPIPLSVNFTNLDASSIMTDLVKAGIGNMVTEIVTDLLKAALEDWNAQVKDAVAKATQPQADRIKALVSNAKAQNEVLKSLGDGIKKAATKKQVDAIAKASRPAQGGGSVLPFHRPDLSNLQVVPAPGDTTSQQRHGVWTADTLSDRIDSEMRQLQKAGRNYETTNRLNVLADAQVRLATPGANADAIAKSLNIQAA